MSRGGRKARRRLRRVMQAALILYGVPAKSKFTGTVEMEKFISISDFPPPNWEQGVISAEEVAKLMGINPGSLSGPDTGLTTP